MDGWTGHEVGTCPFIIARFLFVFHPSKNHRNRPLFNKHQLPAATSAAAARHIASFDVRHVNLSEYRFTVISKIQRGLEFVFAREKVEPKLRRNCYVPSLMIAHFQIESNGLVAKDFFE